MLRDEPAHAREIWNPSSDPPPCDRCTAPSFKVEKPRIRYQNPIPRVRADACYFAHELRYQGTLGRSSSHPVFGEQQGERWKGGAAVYSPLSGDPFLQGSSNADSGQNPIRLPWRLSVDDCGRPDLSVAGAALQGSRRGCSETSS